MSLPSTPRTNRFRVNEPTIQHETIDGEVIVINFANGNYHSVTGSGALVWALLMRRQPLDRIVDVLASHYGLDRGTLEETVVPFVSELLETSLIAPDDGSPPEAWRPEGLADDDPFEPPALTTYQDMQEFLLLDPIHDVDETGWPAPKAMTDDDNA